MTSTIDYLALSPRVPRTRYRDKSQSKSDQEKGQSPAPSSESSPASQGEGGSLPGKYSYLILSRGWTGSKVSVFFFVWISRSFGNNDSDPCFTIPLASSISPSTSSNRPSQLGCYDHMRYLPSYQDREVGKSVCSSLMMQFAINLNKDLVDVALVTC